MTPAPKTRGPVAGPKPEGGAQASSRGGQGTVFLQPGGMREGGREGGSVEDQARASTLGSVVAVVMLVSPGKHKWGLKTVAGPAFFCSPEAQEGAGRLLEAAPPSFSLKLS